MKKFLAFSVVAVVVALGGPLLVRAVTVNVNTSNDVSVVSCEQVGSDIRIRRSASESSSVLTSACRDAGHGLRQYTVSCISNTKYRVSWTDCSTPTPQTPTDTQGPSVSLSANAVANSINGSWYKYTVTVSAQDATSNIKGIEVIIKGPDNQVVQSWWIDGRNVASNGSFGVKSVTRTVTRSWLQTNKQYTITAKAYDTAGNSTTSAVAAVYLSGDTVAPTIGIDVTYNAQWYPGNKAKRMVPTLVARANDNQRVSKITIYYNNTGLGEGYSELRTCNVSGANVVCSHGFSDMTRGNFYAVAWDEAGNSVSSYKVAF